MLTVLILEDHADLLECVAEELECLGHRPICSRTIDEARAQLAKHDDISVLITDLQLDGEMRGEAFALAAQAAHPGLRVVVTTGHSAEKLSEEGRRRFALLCKPYTFDALAQAIASPPPTPGMP
ncbi:response regulator [Chitinolyticbacter albus]|uniref:response regulator n=1 Tax=Chitinolyticbacter albus TaxID=2961951 RepID=UPI00210B6177|nr:response regulator [Chitinolyticbacter albus]